MFKMTEMLNTVSKNASGIKRKFSRSDEELRKRMRLLSRSSWLSGNFERYDRLTKPGDSRTSGECVLFHRFNSRIGLLALSLDHPIFTVKDRIISRFEYLASVPPIPREDGKCTNQQLGNKNPHKKHQRNVLYTVSKTELASIKLSDGSKYTIKCCLGLTRFYVRAQS
ncbi:hypothetical protein ACOME3_003673 [Neoechinorhynchus agilis]